MKHVLVIREIVCFKEGEKFFNYNCLHYEWNAINETIVEWIRLATFCWDRKDMG